MLSHFGLCVGLYLVSVSLSFGSMQGVCKKYSKHNKEKQHVLAVLLMFLMLCLTMFATQFARYFLVLRWHLNGTFGGVWVVSCWCVSWWWWHGML